MSNPPIPQEQWNQEITAMAQRQPDWLWHGFIARGNVTLLTSMWKSGKTTLLSMLLERRNLGGALAGLAVKPGKTAVITEEDSQLWAHRLHGADLGNTVCFFSRPFNTLPSPDQWRALLDRILVLHDEHGLDLVAIDPLAPLLRCENNPHSMFEVLMPLADFTRRGMAVLLLHHPGKGKPRPGHAARGSSALLGHVDISIEMRHPGGLLTRRRRFVSLSRHADTPRRLLLELNADATDYLPVPDGPDDFHKNWNVLRMVFEDAPQKLTRLDVLDEWPQDFDKPAVPTIRRWLDRALKLNLIACEGSGRKADPFRYWLPEREAVWKENILYEVLEEQRQRLKIPFESLRERKKKLSEPIRTSGADDGDDDQGEPGA